MHRLGTSGKPQSLPRDIFCITGQYATQDRPETRKGACSKDDRTCTHGKLKTRMEKLTGLVKLRRGKERPQGEIGRNPGMDVHY